MRKYFKCLGNCFRDFFRAAPGLTVLMLFVAFAEILIQVVQPAALSGLLTGISSENAVLGKGFLGSLFLFCGMLMTQPVLNAFWQWVNLMMVKVDQYFGGKLFAFSKHISLEEMENPKVLEQFKKANAVIGEGWIDGFLFNFAGFLSDIAVCIGIIFVVSSYSGILVWVTVIGALPHFLCQLWGEKMRLKMWRGQMKAQRKRDYLWQLFCSRDAVKEMRTMGFADFIKDKWVKENDRLVEEKKCLELSATKKYVLGMCIRNVFYAANIGVSLYLMLRGEIKVGEFAACISAFGFFQSNFSNLLTNLTFTVEGSRRVEEYYKYFETETEKSGTKEIAGFNDWIEARNVTFRYKGAKENALKGVDFIVYKGERVVIVGENGSGKTTLSKIIAGVYLPTEGALYYDGRSTAELKRSSLYRRISIVPQDFVHYNFTLRENVCISDIVRLNETGEVERLLHETAGDAFVDKTGGLDVQLGREFGGVEMSGGEWQKVAIARGLWKDSDVIILDEPTSALDPMIEYDILSKFVDMIVGRTSIIISHRVGICRTADKIIVMKDGRVAECGRHEQLLSLGGEYARLWTEQAKWYA